MMMIWRMKIVMAKRVSDKNLNTNSAAVKKARHLKFADIDNSEDDMGLFWIVKTAAKNRDIKQFDSALHTYVEQLDCIRTKQKTVSGTKLWCESVNLKLKEDNDKFEQTQQF